MYIRLPSEGCIQNILCILESYAVLQSALLRFMCIVSGAGCIVQSSIYYILDTFKSVQVH